MTDLTAWDTLFALLVFVVFPVYSRFTIAGVIEILRREGEKARIAAYQKVIATWLAFTAFVIGLWTVTDRPWAAIGVTAGDEARTWVALAVAIAVIALIVLPIRYIAKTPERHDELPKQLGDVAEFMPQSIREEGWFRLVSLNAGITEELIFRGYLLWYLQHFLATAWAAAVAVIAFGLAHWYQGARQLPGILFISAVAVALYLYTGSLLVPVIFHVVIDALQGHYIARIRRAEALTT